MNGPSPPAPPPAGEGSVESRYRNLYGNGGVGLKPGQHYIRLNNTFRVEV